MYLTQLLSLVFVLFSDVTIVQSQYNSNEDLKHLIFKKKDFLSNDHQQQQLRDYVPDSASLYEQKLMDPLMKRLSSSDMHETKRKVDDNSSIRGRWPRLQHRKDIFQQTWRRFSKGIDYYRPLESSTCGRQQFAPKFVERIVGGHEAVPHSWPWQVLYQETVSCGSPGEECANHCGGTLINEKFVLTAAHCIGSVSNIKAITIIAGIHNKGNVEEQIKTWQIIKVQKIIVHEGWNSNTLENDIALLQLAKPVRFNKYVQPACLPGPDPKPDSKVVLIGWGLVETGGELSPVLKQTVVHVIGNCTQYWDGINILKQICFKDSTLTSAACQGDSGGPALQKHNGQWVVEGVTSFGHRTCEVIKHGLPDVYTRVSAYLSWIHNIIGR